MNGSAVRWFVPAMRSISMRAVWLWLARQLWESNMERSPNPKNTYYMIWHKLILSDILNSQYTGSNTCKSRKFIDCLGILPSQPESSLFSSPHFGALYPWRTPFPQLSLYLASMARHNNSKASPLAPATTWDATPKGMETVSFGANRYLPINIVPRHKISIPLVLVWVSRDLFFFLTMISFKIFNASIERTVHKPMVKKSRKLWLGSTCSCTWKEISIMSKNLSSAVMTG